jgi:hypothetical protein
MLGKGALGGIGLIGTAGCTATCTGKGYVRYTGLGGREKERCGLYSYISGVERLVWKWKNCHQPQPGATRIAR